MESGLDVATRGQEKEKEKKGEKEKKKEKERRRQGRCLDNSCKVQLACMPTSGEKKQRDVRRERAAEGIDVASARERKGKREGWERKREKGQGE